MRFETHEERPDPARPALVVKYGTTRRKIRYLDNDVTVIGRVSGCDLGLVSPEVAPVHCVIVKLADGWRIRDCSSRGTRLNGVAVHDEPLVDGDTLVIGTFSFEAHLPRTCLGPPRAEAPAKPKTIAEVDPEKWRQSRRRFAELALALRQRLREQEGDREALDRGHQDLERAEQRYRSVSAELGRRKEALDRRAAELDSYAQHLRRELEKARLEQKEALRQIEIDRAGAEQDMVRQNVEIRATRDELALWQAELAARDERLRREREELDDRFRELVNHRLEVEQLRGESQPTPAACRETLFDGVADERIESARRLLKQLAERRQAAAQE